LARAAGPPGVGRDTHAGRDARGGPGARDGPDARGGPGARDDSSERGVAASRPDIGDIALATALSWLEFRGVYAFLPGRPHLAAWYVALSARPSMLATALAGDTRD
jgi:hypothetical protein